MKKILCFTLALCLLFLCSCSDEPELREKNIYAMDTVITLNLYGSWTQVNDAYDMVAAIVTNIEKLISRTYDNSQCSAINGNATVLYYPDEEFYEALTTALAVAGATDGAYDPTVAGLTDLWKINDPEAEGIPDDSEIKEALSHVGYDTITADELKITKADPKTKIDLGGIGKGYAAEKAVEYLKGTELDFGIISFGGNIAVFGSKPENDPFKIAIRDPQNTEATVGTVDITSGFISVSGSYERYREVDGKIYHHIFDTKTGYPVENELLSVAVISENGTEADALSTALFALGAQDGYEFYQNSGYEFEAVFITGSGEILLTDGIKDSFILTSSDYVVAEW